MVTQLAQNFDVVRDKAAQGNKHTKTHAFILLRFLEEIIASTPSPFFFVLYSVSNFNSSNSSLSRLDPKTNKNLCFKPLYFVVNYSQVLQDKFLEPLQLQNKRQNLQAFVI